MNGVNTTSRHKNITRRKRLVLGPFDKNIIVGSDFEGAIIHYEGNQRSYRLEKTPGGGLQMK